MPHQDQNDWPSFETVLRDVAPDSPTARSLASADRRAQYAKTMPEVRATKSEKPSDAEVPTPRSSTDAEGQSFGRDTVDLRSLGDTRLPAPLPPLEIDTSSVRALIGFEPGPMPDASHPALDDLQPSPELQLSDLQDPVLELDSDSALALFDDESVVAERILADLDVDEAPEFEFEAEAEPEALDFEATAETQIQPELDFEAAAETQAQPELDFEATAETEPEALDEEALIPVFDAATDGVAFDTSSPWDSSFDSELDESLVFELDDVTLSEIDAAATLATPVELDDPHFDTPTSDNSDTDVFSASDVPELTQPNSLDLDTSLLDDPFAGVSIDLFPESIDDQHQDTTTDGAATDEADQSDNLDSPWDFSIDEPDAVVGGDELGGDELGTVPTPEPADIPDIVSLSYGDPDAIELPDQSFKEELFDDLAPLADAEAINLSDLTADLDDAPESEDHRSVDPQDIDQRKADLFDVTFESDDLGNEDLSDLDQPVQLHSANFDSVAAAEEIEGHLDSLLSFDDPEAEAALANVIPLRPDMDSGDPLGFDEQQNDAIDQPSETAEPATEGLNPSQTRWVSLPPAVPSEAPDPWAHMRPVEEPKKKGFWANRPKFFGGSERRRARAEREEKPVEPTSEDTQVDISYNKECPNCGDECKVDLDDPIGRRVHVSCPSCKHMWHTPYILEESQAG